MLPDVQCDGLKLAIRFCRPKAPVKDVFGFIWKMNQIWSLQPPKFWIYKPSCFWNTKHIRYCIHRFAWNPSKSKNFNQSTKLQKPRPKLFWSSPHHLPHNFQKNSVKYDIFEATEIISQHHKHVFLHHVCRTLLSNSLFCHFCNGIFRKDFPHCAVSMPIKPTEHLIHQIVGVSGAIYSNI